MLPATSRSSDPNPNILLGAVSVTDPVVTPEPSTIALAIVGLGTMGLVHLRRRRAAKAAA